ncbi:MAG: zinc ribbon domain-containing protein [Bacilli bacterium]|nr:zinc ribbon domain-containing protein [Bacilli bacterium]
MVNFNLEGLDRLGDFGEGTVGSFLATAGVLAVFFAILVGVAIILLWVFGSIGLMNLAKKKNLPHPWLAFVPIGRSYLIGKLGFEIYDASNKNATTFMWITLALGAASFLLNNSSGDLGTLVKYGLLFFETWAFYNMFKNLKPKNAVVYTVFTALSGSLLGGLFLYLMKDEEVEERVAEAEVVEEKKEITEEKKEEVKTETKKTESKKENNKVSFCPECGAKLSKDAKFCPECGKKIN